MTTYVNIKNHGKVETVDEFETHKEAREMVKEYQMADRSNSYYLSSKCTNDWREKD